MHGPGGATRPGFYFPPTGNWRASRAVRLGAPAPVVAELIGHEYHGDRVRAQRHRGLTDAHAGPARSNHRAPSGDATVSGDAIKSLARRAPARRLCRLAPPCSDDPAWRSIARHHSVGTPTSDIAGCRRPRPILWSSDSRSVGIPTVRSGGTSPQHVGIPNPFLPTPAVASRAKQHEDVTQPRPCYCRHHERPRCTINQRATTSQGHQKVADVEAQPAGAPHG